MPAPLSLARVRAALRRISPAFPSTDPSTSVGKELDTIGLVMARVVDRFDALAEELFPDGTTELLERWEQVCRVATRTSDSMTQRRDRLLAVLRRVAGPRKDQIAQVLAPVLALQPEQIVFLETLRQQIEDGLTETYSDFTASVTPYDAYFGRAYPSTVDDTGLRWGATVVATDPAATITLAVFHADGTWVSASRVGSGVVAGTSRTHFLGKAAGAGWRVRVSTTAGTAAVSGLYLMVSNDEDSRQIYKFYAQRPPELADAPDLLEAQRLFTRTALAHMRPLVCERLKAITDDPRSLCDRDPMGV